MLDRIRKKCPRIIHLPMVTLLFACVSLSFSAGAPAVFAEGVDFKLTPSGPSYVTPGNNITYELTFKNERNLEMTGIEVLDPLPALTTYVSGGTLTTANGASVVKFELGTLAANTTHTFTLVVNVAKEVKIDKVIENKNITIPSYTLPGGDYLDYYSPGAVGTTVEAPGETMAILKNTDGRAFDVKIDGFNFQNYGNAPPRVFADDLNKDDLFLMFGESACQAGDTIETCVLSGPAKKWKDHNISEMNEGHCDGMAATSLRFFGKMPFKGKSKPEDYQSGATTVSELNFPLQSVENYIAYYFQTQIFYPTVDNEFKGTPVQIVNRLIRDLTATTQVAYTLGVEVMPKHKVGHAIAAYGVEKVNDGEYRILVYDNNFPKQRKYIKIDMSANTWRYVTAATPGEAPTIYAGTATGDTSGGLSILPVSSRDLAAGKYFECSFCNPPQTQVSMRGSTIGDNVKKGTTFHYAGEGALLVVDDMDRGTGYAYDTEEDINEIPGATLAYARGGLGLNVPPRITVPSLDNDEARYTAVISGHTIDEESQGSLAITGEGFAIGVNKVELVPDEFFEFDVSPDGDHIAFTATETGEAPSIFISYDPVDDSDPSIIFDIEGVTLHAGETVYLDMDPELERIFFQDTGGLEESFDITLTMIWPDGDEEQYTEMIDIPAGTDSAYLDFGAWDGLLTPPVYIGDELRNPLVNHRLKLESSISTYDPTPQSNAPAGVFTVEATFSNVTEVSLEDVYFSVAGLGSGDVILNADDGPGGMGATISVPDEVLGEDGILDPFESFTFRFNVGLASGIVSELVIDANGAPYDWTSPNPAPSYDANNTSFVFSVSAGTLLATCGSYNVIKTSSGDIIAPGFSGNVIVGSNKVDELIGSNKDDLIVGLKGHDYIDGRRGNDILCGNEGNDSIFGGKGDDFIDGGNGKDGLLGNKGNDIIYGGPRADYIDGGIGDDTLFGGRGPDYLLGGPGQDNMSGDEGKDFMSGGKGNDTIDGGRGADIISGGPGEDYLSGNYGNDTVEGGKGDDHIYGNLGRDQLFGNKGDDIIDGGKAKDSCIGGQGNDSIVNCENL